VVCVVSTSVSNGHWSRCYWAFEINRVMYECTARSKAWVRGRSPAEIVGSNPTGGMNVCYVCCVLSGRGLCEGLISRLEKLYGVCCVVVCDLETSSMRRPWPNGKLSFCATAASGPRPNHSRGF
jgi:hypothetical protein